MKRLFGNLIQAPMIRWAGYLLPRIHVIKNPAAIDQMFFSPQNSYDDTLISDVIVIGGETIGR